MLGLRLSSFLQRHPNALFWGTFLILNGLLFLPQAWIGHENILWPSFSTSSGAIATLTQLLIQRPSPDLWRLSAELTVVTALWMGLGEKRRAWMKPAFPLLYGLMLIYAIYEAIVVGIYLLEPSFYAQFFLARDALPVLLQHLHARGNLYAIGLLLLICTILVVAGLWRLLLRSSASPDLSRPSRWLLSGLAAYSLIAVALLRQESAQPEAVVSSFTCKLLGNFEASKSLYQRVQRLNNHPSSHLYDYSPYPLLRKPHIYLIFVESYGSVLYQRPTFTEPYRALMRELNDQLQANGWHVATALSEAPTWGGGSWLSYTTTLFGMRIDQHPQYLELLDRYQTERYPSLSATLHDQGYHTVWLAALEDDLSDQAWQKYTRLLGIDQLIRYKDLGYIGPRYGWGPSAPDQWTLHRVQGELIQKIDRPIFFFTITQNSHYPFAPLPPLAEDWRALNQPGEQPDPVDPQTMRLTTLRANYLNAIGLELRLLIRWIIEVGDPNSIFILIGDHQPPAVSRRADGFATPIHILSQDEDFIAASGDYGFVRGLEVPDLQPDLRHEGFYSLFMRLLLKRYGFNQLAQPLYLPNGIELDSDETIN
ncbi:MAG: putative membrane protein [Anaerolineae bacterium]|nr:MAG: putative membrane protein [Anaerolineae bacterium]